MIFRLRLLEMKLSQFFNLKKLPKYHQQAVLLDSPVAQGNLALTNERLRIGRFAGSLEIALQFALHDSLRSACVCDNLVGQHIAKLYARGKRRILRFRLHRKIAVDLTVAGARGNLGKLQHVRLVTQWGAQLLQKKTVLQGNSRHLRIAVKRQRAADAGAKVYSIKTRKQPACVIEKTEIAILNTDASNLRRHRQSRFLHRRWLVDYCLSRRRKIRRRNGNDRSGLCLRGCSGFAFYFRLGHSWRCCLFPV